MKTLKQNKNLKIKIETVDPWKVFFIVSVFTAFIISIILNSRVV